MSTLSTNDLAIEQTLTLESPPGQAGLVVTAPGGLVTGVGMSFVDGGGIVLAG